MINNKVDEAVLADLKQAPAAGGQAEAAALPCQLGDRVRSVYRELGDRVEVFIR